MTGIAYPERGVQDRAQSPLIERLNGEWHERALWIYMAIVTLHWVEHIVQAFQIWAIGMPRPESLGALGMAWPWLVRSEVLHFGFALVMLAGLFALRPGFRGASRGWWTASLVIQVWHFIEHSLLQGQASVGANLFGAPVPTSFGQELLARPELHLVYNGVVFLPMVVAMILHARDHGNPRCTCAA